jgi:putative transposase
MHKGYQFRLILTKDQEEYCWKASNAARYIYNWTLETKTKIYQEQGISVSGYNMCKLLTALKKEPDHQWLNEIHNKVLNKAVLDCNEAFERMFKGQSRFPKFKSKKKTTPSFCIETSIENKGLRVLSDGTVKDLTNSKIKFSKNNKVQLSGIGCVQLSKNAKHYNLWFLTENNIPVYNGRVKYDGEHWNLSFSVDIPTRQEKLTDEVIGIDLGIKDTAICSNEITYKNINKTSTHIKRLEKRKKRYQRQINRKYQINKTTDPETGKPKFNKTNNIKKLEKKTAKIDKTLSNIRKTYNHQISREIVNRKPQMIVMEDLNIKGMMKNKHLAKAIQQQNLYQLKTFIKYKSERQGTKFVEAPRNYKSTQLCSHCGAVQKMLLSQRVYICPVCGHTEDRDLNASHNLQNYGLSLLQA